MRLERREEPRPRLRAGSFRVAVHAQPRLDEGAHQPGPDGSLVIGAVARERRAFVVRDVAGLAGRQRPQSERRQQPMLDRLDHASGTIRIEQPLRQAADGEDLVRAARGVDPARHVIDVDHVVQTPGVRVPEAGDELLRARRRRPCARRASPRRPHEARSATAPALPPACPRAASPSSRPRARPSTSAAIPARRTPAGHRRPCECRSACRARSLRRWRGPRRAAGPDRPAPACDPRAPSRRTAPPRRR